MKKVIVVIMLVSAFSFFFSCTHQPILPDHQVSYQTDIKPIFISGCQQSGCHDSVGSGHGEAFPLVTYNDVARRVVPGQPKQSRIYQSVTTGSGEEFMPRPPYSPLTDRQIKLLFIWIAQGAKDN
ncbi:MAG: hypothetical protein NT084_06440 [Bacteroidetes bacterium]|nr:hypothetical protein [Bacteroidota bacterium]